MKEADPRLVFVRLHAAHPTRRHHRLLQSVTYDRTVIIALDGRSDDELLATMQKRGRRDLRKGLREQPLDCAEETGLSVAEFAEMYAVLQETAARDGFGLHPASVYTTMLGSLGPDAARLFVGRHDGAVQACALPISPIPGGAVIVVRSASEVGRATFMSPSFRKTNCLLSGDQEAVRGP